MTRRPAFLAAATATLAFAASASAHPGHGPAGFGLDHWLREPGHGLETLVLGAGAALAVLGGRWAFRRARRRE
jgi:hypothetical protein